MVSATKFRRTVLIAQRLSTQAILCEPRFKWSAEGDRLRPLSSATMTSGYNRDKVFEKLRNAAKKMAADTVLLVKRGGSHLTLWSWDRREYMGRAIRYADRSCAPKQ
jgi:hypothetical protein